MKIARRTMKVFKYIIPFLAIAAIFACSKLENDALNVDEVSAPTAPLNIKVINDDDQLPIAGVKVIISRQTTSKGEFNQIDTIRTDQNGLIKTQLTFPNKVKVEVDTTYYHKGEQVLDFLTSSGGNAELHTTPKFGMTALNIAVTDESDVAIANFPLLIATKAYGTSDFVSTGGTEYVGIDGKLIVALPYPNEVKVAVADTMTYFPQTLATSFQNVRGASLTLKAVKKPTTVPLEITVVDKDNGNLLSGIEVAVLHKLTGEAAFKNINLVGITDANGKLILNAPYEGEVQIKTNDDAYFFPDEVITRMAYEKNRKVTLSSKKLIPKANVDIAVVDQSNNQILPGVTVKVSSKIGNETTFTLDTIAVSDENGKLNVRVRFSGEMKFEVVNDTYFANKEVTVQNIGSSAKQANLPLTLKTAAYPEPITTSLMVSTLTLNNSITLSAPTDVIADKRGNIYISDQNNNRIVRVSRNGNTTVLAGNGTAGAVDGAGTTASFNRPRGMVLNDAGTELFVTDYAGHKVRKVTINLTNMTATVSTIAGSGTAGTLDAIGTAATFNSPSGITLDETADVLYLTDNSASTSAGRIRKIALATNTVTTLGTTTIYAPASIALNASKTSLYLGAFGNIYGSTESYLFRVATATGARTVLKQTKTTNFNDPSGIFVSPAGVIFVSSEKAHSIARVTSEVTTNSTFGLLAGSGTDDSITTPNVVTGTAGNVNGAAANARFNLPWAIKYNSYSGAFLIADQGNNSIRIMKSSTIN